MGWYKDKGLAVLDGQMRDKYPGIVIYGIGDEAHRNRISDHNPEADGSVDASDYMLGKTFGKEQAEWFFWRMVTIADKRISYVIYNRKIWNPSVSKSVRDYDGSNPHTDHVHLSVNDKYENDESEWRLMEKMRANEIELDGFTLPKLKYGESDKEYGGYDAVKRVQRILKIDDDGIYGKHTRDAVKEVMDGKVDGKTVGIDEWRRILGLVRG